MSPHNVSDLEFRITNESGFVPTPKDGFFEKTIEEVDLTLNKKSIVLIRLSKRSYCIIYLKPGSKDDKQYFNFYFFGKDSYKELLKIRNYVREEILNPNRKMMKSIYVNGENIKSKWSSYSVDKLDDATIIVNESIRQSIYNYIDNMVSIRESCKNLSKTVRNKMHAGILFYGKPGTGKSTMATAIAYHYEADLIYINPNNIAKVDPSTIMNHSSSRKVVIIIEDIDVLCKNRDEMKTIEERENLTLLLQILDGTISITDRFCIQIATTNNYETLDPALIRPGRFDLKIELTDLNEESARKMCDRFNIDYKLLKDEKFPINPAYLQAKIIQSIRDNCVND